MWDLLSQCVQAGNSHYLWVWHWCLFRFIVKCFCVTDFQTKNVHYVSLCVSQMEDDLKRVLLYYSQLPLARHPGLSNNFGHLICFFLVFSSSLMLAARMRKEKTASQVQTACWQLPLRARQITWSNRSIIAHLSDAKRYNVINYHSIPLIKIMVVMNEVWRNNAADWR